MKLVDQARQYWTNVEADETQKSRGHSNLRRDEDKTQREIRIRVSQKTFT